MIRDLLINLLKKQKCVFVDLCAFSFFYSRKIFFVFGVDAKHGKYLEWSCIILINLEDPVFACLTTFELHYVLLHLHEWLYVNYPIEIAKHTE